MLINKKVSGDPSESVEARPWSCACQWGPIYVELAESASGHP